MDVSQLNVKPQDSPDYMHIDENLYRFNDRKTYSDEILRCTCEVLPEDSEAACGESANCINRLTLMECQVDTCPCKEKCKNRRFQLKQYPKLEIFKTEKKGYGLRTLQDLPTNSFVIEYVGEVLNKRLLVSRSQQYHNENRKHFYFMTLLPNEIIDATQKGNLSRFINHSCSPNCVTQKWMVGEYMRMGFFTCKPLKAGTELTFDYKFEDYGDEPQKCFCEEPNCRGTIGISRKKIDVNEESDNESLNEEDAQYVEEICTLGLTNVSEVPAFINSIVRNIHNETKILKYLMILEDTQNPICLRKAYLMDGLRLIRAILVKYKESADIILAALNVLKRFPIAVRNGLDKHKIFSKVEKLSKHTDARIGAIAHKLLSQWDALETEYRIPKASSLQIVDSPAKVVDSHDDKKEHKPADVNEPPPHIPGSNIVKESPMPGIGQHHHLSSTEDRKTAESNQYHSPRDRRSYNSSREHGYKSDRNYSQIGNNSSNYTNNRRDYDYGRHEDGRNAGYNSGFRSSRDDDYRNRRDYPSRSNINERDQDDHRKRRYEDNRASSSNKKMDAKKETETLALPPNWQRVRNDAGEVFYHNRLTNVTQAELPVETTFSHVEGYSAADLEMVVGQARAEQEHQITATSSTSRQDKVKAQVSTVVKSVLNRYRRAIDVELYKNIARKLTYSLTEKEVARLMEQNEINSFEHLSDKAKSKMKRYVEEHLLKIGISLKD